MLQPDERAGGGGDAADVPHILLQPPHRPHRPRRGIPRRQRCLPPHTIGIQVSPVTSVWRYLGANTTIPLENLQKKPQCLSIL